MRLILVLSLFANLFFIDKASANFFFHTVGKSAVAADVIPDAVNWNNIFRDPCAFDVEGNSQSITGISQDIDLTIDNTGVGVHYQLNGGAWVSLTDNGETILSNISSGTSIKFKSIWPTGSSATVTIKNASDAQAILDTFTVTVPMMCGA